MMTDFIKNEYKNISLIDKIENDYKDKIIQTRNTFNNILNNFMVNHTNSTKINSNFVDELDYWFSSFINFIKSKYINNNINTKWVFSHINIENMFRVLLQLEVDNVYITYNMFLSKSNYVNEFINNIYNYSCSIIEPYDTKQFLKSIDNTQIVNFKNHKSIVDYIIKRDFITVKEIINLNNYNLDDKMICCLNNYVSEYIEHNGIIIGTDKHEHKIYNWEFSGTINEIVKKFYNDINLEIKNNNKKRHYQNL